MRARVRNVCHGLAADSRSMLECAGHLSSADSSEFSAVKWNVTFWKTMEDCGGLWRTLEDFGGLWRTVEDSGGLWRTLQYFGVT